MHATDLILAPIAPFAGLTAPASTAGGVIVSDCDGSGLATLLVRRNRREALAARIREQYGVELPQRPQRVEAGNFAMAGVGRGAWLVTGEQHDGNQFAATLAAAMAEVASVADQSDGYARLRLAGPKVRETLCKLLPVDLHPRAFKVGDVAVTVASHMGVTLWRLPDASDGAAGFEITMFRSVARSFWEALSHSAGEFGLRLANGVTPLRRSVGAT